MRKSRLVATLVTLGLGAGFSGPALSQTSSGNMIDTSQPPQENLLLGGSSYTGTPSGDPIRLGLVTDLAGRTGRNGPHLQKSLEWIISVANENGGIMGRPVELVTRDDQQDASIHGREVRNIVTTQNVDMVFGAIWSGGLAAQAGLTEILEVPVISGAAGSVSFVSDRGSIYHGLVSGTSNNDACGFVKFMGERHPEWKRVAYMRARFAYGTDHREDFERCMKIFTPDAEIVVEQDYELGEPNFVPIISAMMRAEPDVIVGGGLFGPDLLRFWRQYESLGATVPVNYFGDLDSTQNLGNDIPPNMLYPSARGLYTDIPSAEPWINHLIEQLGEPPVDYAIGTVGAFIAYKTAVEKAGTTEPVAVMRAFRCMTYYDPRGWTRIRTLNGEASAPQYVGALKPDSEVGHPVYDPEDSMAFNVDGVWIPDEVLLEVMPESAVMTEADCT